MNISSFTSKLGSEITRRKQIHKDLLLSKAETDQKFQVLNTKTKELRDVSPETYKNLEALAETRYAAALKEMTEFSVLAKKMKNLGASTSDESDRTERRDWRVPRLSTGLLTEKLTLMKYELSALFSAHGTFPAWTDTKFSTV